MLSLSHFLAFLLQLELMKFDNDQNMFFKGVHVYFYCNDNPFRIRCFLIVALQEKVTLICYSVL